MMIVFIKSSKVCATPQFWPLPSSSYLFTCLLAHSIRTATLSILCAPYGLNIRWLLTTSLGNG